MIPLFVMIFSQLILLDNVSVDVNHVVDEMNKEKVFELYGNMELSNFSELNMAISEFDLVQKHYKELILEIKTVKSKFLFDIWLSALAKVDNLHIQKDLNSIRNSNTFGACRSSIVHYLKSSTFNIAQLIVEYVKFYDETTYRASSMVKEKTSRLFDCLDETFTIETYDKELNILLTKAKSQLYGSCLQFFQSIEHYLVNVAYINSIKQLNK